MPHLASARLASPLASFVAAVLLVAACGVTADALASRTAVAAAAPARTGCISNDGVQAACRLRGR